MSASRAQIEAAADAVERTMRGLGVWTEPPPPLVPFQAPFGMDAMPFEHWIQLVLVPRMREIARSGAPVPPSSNLAAHAVREFDGRHEMAPLVDALRGVDALSAPVPRAAPPAPPSPFGIISMAGLGAVFGVLVALVAGRWAADTFEGWFDPQVSAAFSGTIQPDAAHTPLRAIVLAQVRADGTLVPGSGTLLVNRRGIPTPGALNTVPQLEFDGGQAPDATAVAAWLVRAGVGPGAAAQAAAAEIANIVAVAVATPTRADLDSVQVRLPDGTPDPQLLDIEARTPGWFETAVGLGVAIVVVIPILVVVTRRMRRAS